MKSLPVLITFVCTALAVDGARILAVFPFQAKSHYNVYEPVLKRLAEKGHEVLSVTHFPQKVALANFTDVDIAPSLPSLIGTLSIKHLSVATTCDNLRSLLTIAGPKQCRVVLDYPEVKKLLGSKEKFDVFITEIFGSDCYLGIGHALKIPTVVGVVSSVTLPWSNDIAGNPDNPSYIPNWLSWHSDRMSFYERLVNCFYYVYTKYAYRSYSTIPSYEVAKQYFGDDLPDLDTLRSKISLVLTNGHRAVSTLRPLAPGHKELGGMHIPSSGPKPLPKDLQEYLDSQDKHGVIYFSFGSQVDISTMANDSLNALRQALQEVPQQILLKCADSNILGLKKNTKCMNWLPQLSILCHPNVRLFITHGGLLGSQEAVYCGVPILGIPLFADQNLNVAYFVKKGLALKLDYLRLSYELVSNALSELLRNKRYKEAAQKASLQFRDNPIPPLEEAVYWVEYLIRHGPDSLKTEATSLTWYQYLLLDVAFVVVASMFLLLWILYKLLTLIFQRSVLTDSDKKQR